MATSTFELVKLGSKTYCLKNATNIGIYKEDEQNVWLIDTGNDKEAGKKILRIIEAEGWRVKGIINTHSNADHVGGNKVIQDRADCFIYANGIEKDFINHPVLEPAFLYGAFPFNELENKFLMAKSSIVNLGEDDLPNGLEIINLPGHYFDMIGVRTNDNVYFLADSLFSEETINKYHIFFLYDVNKFLSTLDYIETLRGKFYVPSHAEITNDVKHLVQLNRDKVTEILNKITSICKEKVTFEKILKILFDDYDLKMNANQYVLVGSTIKSYLSYLCNENKLKYEFINNKMYWYLNN